jgi:hypothetical protein
MREQRACISRMPKVFIHAASDKPVIAADHNGASKEFSQGINRYPSKGDSSEQQPNTKSGAEISGSLDMTDVGKTDIMPTSSTAAATSQKRTECLSQSLAGATSYRRR